jgi:hypothetical protein
MIKIVIGLSLLCTAVLAEEKKPPLPAQLEQLKYWSGTWTCEGKVHKNLVVPMDKTVTANVTQSPILQDRWFSTKIEEKSPQDPGTLEVMLLNGWDVATKRFVSMNATSSGSSGMSFSDGWQGDSWTWAGEGSAFSGKTYKSRSVTTKKSATEFDLKSEVSGPDGKWMLFREAHCKKEK